MFEIKKETLLVSEKIDKLFLSVSAVSEAEFRPS
jgi:hypothetical protein